MLETVACGLTGGRAWWIAPTYKIANEGWNLIRHFALRIPGAAINRSDRIATFPGGGTAEVRSADNPDTLVGAGLNLAVLDEAADMVETVWTESIRPSLADRKGSAIFITTPKGYSNWTYSNLWRKCDDDKLGQWSRWHMPTWTNPYIDSSEIEQMRADMHATTFAQEVGAEFTSMAGRVFGDFARERHVRSLAPEHGLPIYLGLDFGYRTFAWLAVQIDNKGMVRVFAEGEWKDCSTERGCERLQTLPWWGKMGHEIGGIDCDPAGSAHDVQTGISDVNVLRTKLGVKVSFSQDPRHRNPEWRASRIRDQLLTASGHVRLFVDTGCASVIRMFEESIYPDLRKGSGEKGEPLKDGINDHMRDALGYLLVNRLHVGKTIISSSRPWR